MGRTMCLRKRPGLRDQDVFTPRAVARNGQREVDGTRQHLNRFGTPGKCSRMLGSPTLKGRLALRPCIADVKWRNRW